MDSELHFQWPKRAGHESVGARAGQARPSVSRPIAVPEERGLWPDAGDLQRQLDAALATIAQLKAACRAAETRIAELAAEHGACQSRLTAQRRRLLVLERQVEGMGGSPVTDVTSPRASWLDRLLGGAPPVPTA
jgi:hypothetical protein